MGLFSKLYKSSEPKCPIDEDMRVWMENSFLWLMTQFGQQKIMNAQTLLPEPNNFPFVFKIEEEDAYNIVKFIAPRMDINPNDIKISFYKDHSIELDNQMGHQLFSQKEGNSYTSGLYLDKDNEDKKFIIAIEIEQIKDSQNLIATISHELAHIKILGEKRLDFNDECLTDLVTVFFGTGIFTANSSFKFYSSQEKWGYHSQGYLLQQEWGYALALYSYIRQETEQSWINYLTPNIRSDFIKSFSFIINNADKVLI